MAGVYRDANGDNRRDVSARARLSIRDRTDSRAVLRFEDADGVLCVSLHASLFPKLVDLIQFAALSPAPPIPPDAPPPGGERAVSTSDNRWRG